MLVKIQMRSNDQLTEQTLVPEAKIQKLQILPSVKDSLYQIIESINSKIVRILYVTLYRRTTRVTSTVRLHRVTATSARLATLRPISELMYLSYRFNQNLAS